MIINSISPSGSHIAVLTNYQTACDLVLSMKLLGFHSFSFEPTGKKGFMSPSNFSASVRMIRLITAINVRDSLTAALSIK